jgi:hypothetical protein
VRCVSSDETALCAWVSLHLTQVRLLLPPKPLANEVRPCVDWRSGDGGEGHDHRELRVYGLDVDAPDDGGQRQGGFEHGKVVTDAGPRSGAMMLAFRNQSVVVEPRTSGPGRCPSCRIVHARAGKSAADQACLDPITPTDCRTVVDDVVRATTPQQGVVSGDVVRDGNVRIELCQEVSGGCLHGRVLRGDDQSLVS